MTDDGARQLMVEVGRSLFERGLTPGRTGNLSVRLSSGWLATPTGASLGRLDPAELTVLDDGWVWQAGLPPTKELGLHAVLYEQFPDAGAVVHLHSVHVVAVSCLEPAPDRPPIRPLTPYFVMKVGPLAWIPYQPPGDPRLADELRRDLDGRRAAVLANHGSIVAGADLERATDGAEELEAAARLELLIGDRPARPLTPAQVSALTEMEEERVRRGGRS